MEFPELAHAENWTSLHNGFRWHLPEQYNLAELICERWARAMPDRVALIDLDDTASAREWTYRELSRRSSQLANALVARGIGRGDRIGVLLPQSAEVVLTWIAAAKLGAIIVPLFTLFGEDGLSYRLSDSGCAALITDRKEMAKIAAIRDQLAKLQVIYAIDGAADGAEDLMQALDRARDSADVARTGPDDPLLISYTSGTTGPPKGALHGQRVLAAHTTGARCLFDFLPHEGDVMWTPADWAWMGGSMNAMAPALYFGVPLVAYRMGKFDPERAFDLMARHKVRTAFFPPTALKLMRRVPDPHRFRHDLRVLVSAGEAMGAEVLAWGHEAFAAPINEFYGQTECNMVIGNNARLMRAKPGSMGKPMPGHEAAVLGPDLMPLPRGEVGELALRTPDTGLFLGYWNQPEKTADKFRTDAQGQTWMLTGDEARIDGGGYLHFQSRTDDVITSSGYRVGPTEIEECLASHPAVAVAAVVGQPDPVRTEVIRAFVKLSPEAVAGDATAAALIAHVKIRLSPHLAPVGVDFIDEIPVTASGKIMRRELRATLEEGSQ